MLSYNQALEFIHGLNRFGTKLGLQNITKLLEILGNPHREMNIIHVAGTNGKGSTCAIIDSVLRSAGYRVGLYTSPYLEIFNERMRIDGKNISDEDLARLTQKVQEAVFYMREHDLGSPTEFEVVTAIGFLYFKEQAVDFLILEVGMGGRLDATNVITPLVSVITPISYDHQQYLGDTLSDIAREKCGIIKPGIPVISAPQEPEAMKVIEETCQSRKCTLIKVWGQRKDSIVDDCITYDFLQDDLNGTSFNLKTPKHTYEKLQIRLLGHHQVDNAATAIAAIETLELYGVVIAKDAIYQGLENAHWSGRLEVLRQSPTVLIDGAHNIAGIRTLKDTLNKHFTQKRKILVLGILGDKDYTHMLDEIIPIANTVITTAPDNPRALSAKELAESIWKAFPDKAVRGQDMAKANLSLRQNIIRIYSRENIKDAINLANTLAEPEDMIIYAGSLYMIGSVRTLLK